ncbi:8532_t:CDS:2 [Acaulospora morrowiae]|uniref:8532_t:CDS:1 n=1 Tax=Acaulospora morrowiae TaxID=94023 RepID=A0A9N8VFT6_9GLOM|nr:8532_t:CDS:2 [Acaulospora morrowiae]
MASLTAWVVNDNPESLNVDPEGLVINYIGTGRNAATIRTNNRIIRQSGLFYFEVHIQDIGENGTVGIGFCAKTVDLNKLPGCDDNSWGFHSNGDIFCYSDLGRSYGPSYTTGDTIGCCLNFSHKTISFIKNGVHLGIAFRWFEGNIYPCIGLKSRGGSIKVNFGHKRFKYEAMNDDDIEDKSLKESWNKIMSKYDDRLLRDRFKELTRSFEIDSNDHAFLQYRAKAYFIMGKYEEALSDLTKLLEINQNDEYALSYRGEIYYVTEKNDKSIEDLDKLVRINPSNEWAQKALEEVNRGK